MIRPVPVTYGLKNKNNLYGQTLLCTANQVGLQITIHCVQKKNTRAWKRYEAV